MSQKSTTSAKKNTGKTSSSRSKKTTSAPAEKKQTRQTKQAAPAEKKQTKQAAAAPEVPAAAPVEPIRRKDDKKARILLGALFFLLAFVNIFYMFNHNAALLHAFKTVFSCLLGVGFYFTIPALFWAGILQFKNTCRDRRLATISTLCLPLVCSVFYELFFIQEVPTGGGIVEAVKYLAQKGMDLMSGGAVGGTIALYGGRFLSRPFMGVLTMAAGLLLLAFAIGKTPASLLNAFRDWRADRSRSGDDYYEDDEDDDLPPEDIDVRSFDIPYDEEFVPDEPIEDVRKEPAKKKKAASQKKSADAPQPAPRWEFDVPMDDDPSEKPANENALDYDSGDDALTVFELREDKGGSKAKRKPRAADKPTRTYADEVDIPMDEEPAPAKKKAASPTAAEAAAAADAAIDAAGQKAKQVTKKEARAEQKKVAREVKKAQAAAGDDAGYQLPGLNLLNEAKAVKNADARSKQETEDTEDDLRDILSSFGINPNLQGSTCGPTVALYKLELDQGVKLSKLTNLADDIALNLGVSGVRIAPVEGEARMVGIEVPNRVVTPVPIRSVIESDNFKKAKSPVSFAVGKDIAGNAIVGDIARLPHLLIAGTTGSGKSVCINGILISLLYKASPRDVKLIMVDPKKVELGIYNGIPHLLIPVVTEPKKAAGALQWAVVEMMRRYSLFSEAGVRKLAEFNQLADKEDNEYEHMPNIVVIIDELADLMLVAAKEVEESICRIAQLGRAAGMHLVVATQRPSSDVITGLMKANIPSRIAFSVASAMESRIILDNSGAEKLVGKGDMLYHPIGAGKPQRVQGCMISDEEVAAVVQFVKNNAGLAEYDTDIITQVNVNAEAAGSKNGKSSNGSANAEPQLSGQSGDYDELLLNAVDIVLEIGNASVSMLQRRLKLGYSRAARLVDQMEELGYVGPFEGSKPRQLLITKEEWTAKRAAITGMTPEQLAIQMNDEAAEADADEVPAEDADLDEDFE